MKAGKIVILLVILILVGAGVYLMQKNKQDKALTTHNQKKFEQLREAAKTSSASGLYEMTAAIKKYHKAKGQYPKKLMDLYPEYIPDRAFISTLNWEYTQEKGSFLVKRAIKGKRLYSAMGPDMKFQRGKQQGADPEQVIVSSGQRQQARKEKASVFSKKPGFTTQTPKKTMADLLTSRTRKRREAGGDDALSRLKKQEPDVVIVKKSLENHEKFLLSLDGDKLYIWKTRDGIIGFSDIQYPDVAALTIYKNQSWLEYKAGKPAKKKKRTK